MDRMIAVRPPRVLWALAALSCSFSGVFAQGKIDSKVSLDDLRTPASPAFVLLGVEPSGVERPQTPKALALSFISATGQKDLIPQNYAVEVAPYWLSSHPTLTFDEYYNADVPHSMLQSLSLSFATSRSVESLDSVSGGTALGFGARTLLLPGRANSRLDTLRLQLTEKLDRLLRTEDINETEKLKAELRTISLDIQAQDKRRVGWVVEVAGAAAAVFPEENFDRGFLSSLGGRVTTSYRLEEPRIDFLMVLRYIWAKPSQHITDLGGRVHLESGDITLSAEYVYRSTSTKEVTGKIGSVSTGLFQEENAYRLAGIVEYRVQQDIYVTLTFGRNYGPKSSGGGNLIAQLGVNFGFGQVPLLSMK